MPQNHRFDLDKLSLPVLSLAGYFVAHMRMLSRKTCPNMGCEESQGLVRSVRKPISKALWQLSSWFHTVSWNPKSTENKAICEHSPRLRVIQGYTKLHKAILVSDKQGYSIILAKPYGRSHKSDNSTYINSVRPHPEDIYTLILCKAIQG